MKLYILCTLNVQEAKQESKAFARSKHEIREFKKAEAHSGLWSVFYTGDEEQIQFANKMRALLAEIAKNLSALV